MDRMKYLRKKNTNICSPLLTSREQLTEIVQESGIFTHFNHYLAMDYHSVALDQYW